jgi:molybdopterin converting factor small subunit
MIVRVKLFAMAKQLAECGEVSLEVSERPTVAEVQGELLAKLPALAGVASHARWAVDNNFAGLSRKITPESEIALIPPVSGG